MMISVATPPGAVAYDDNALCLIASLTASLPPLRFRLLGFAARSGQPRLARDDSRIILLRFSCCCRRDSEDSFLSVQA